MAGHHPFEESYQGLNFWKHYDRAARVATVRIPHIRPGEGPDENRIDTWLIALYDDPETKKMSITLVDPDDKEQIIEASTEIMTQLFMGLTSKESEIKTDG